MTWTYNETTHQGLDADGGSVTGLSLVELSGTGTAPTFEPDEGYLGKYWITSAEPLIENTCVDGGDDNVYIVQYDLTASMGSAIDLTSVLYQFWFLYTAKTGETLQQTDAIRLRVADSGQTTAPTALTVNYEEYELTGSVNGGIQSSSDPNGVKSFYDQPLLKSWNSFIVGGANRITTTGGTGADLTDIRWAGVVLRHAAANTGNDPAFAFDWFKSGSAYTCTGTEDLDGLRQFDIGVPGDRGDNPDYGVERGFGIFFEPLSGIDIGNGTTATTLTCEDQFISFNPFAEEVPYNWTVTNNATLNLGRLDQQGQDDYPVGGCTLAGTDEVYISSIAFENGSNGNLYGSRIFRFDDLLFGEAAAGTDPTLDVRACDIDTVRNVEFRSDDLDLLNSQFHDPLPTFLDCAAAFEDDAGSFTAVTTNWNNTTTATTIFPAMEAIGDGHVFGFAEQFSSVEFEISTSGVAGVVSWQYWNGTTWSALSNVVDDTSSFTANVSEGAYNRYRVTWDQPTDWATRTISTVTAYYIRANITTVYTTNPQIQQGRIGQRRVGQLFVAPNSLSEVRFFKCDRALYVSGTAARSLTNYEATDNFYDLVCDDNADITLVNSTFDPDKILQI